MVAQSAKGQENKTGNLHSQQRQLENTKRASQLEVTRSRSWRTHVHALHAACRACIGLRVLRGQTGHAIVVVFCLSTVCFNTIACTTQICRQHTTRSCAWIGALAWLQLIGMQLQRRSTWMLSQ